MTLRIRLFAHMAQHAGADRLSLSVPDSTTLADLLPLLRAALPTLPPLWPPSTLLAVNQEYVAPDTLLHDNDEIAIIPPVSGG